MTSGTSGDLVHFQISAYYCNWLNLLCLSTVSWHLRSWLSRSGWRKMTWSRRQQRGWRPRNPGGSLIMSWSSTRPRSLYLFISDQSNADLTELPTKGKLTWTNCVWSFRPTDRSGWTSCWRNIPAQQNLLSCENSKFPLIITFLSSGIAKMLSQFDSLGLF